MSKRTQKDSGEERRVTAKSKPMMNLVSRCSERTPDVLSSTASESLGKTRHESQTPLSPQTEMCDRTGRPVVCAHSSSYSEWNIDKIWSSREWTSDELMDERTERPVVSSQHADRFIIENDETNSYAEAESDLSLGSRAKLVTDVSVVWFSEIHHTSAHRQYCHVGTRLSSVDWVYSKTLILLGTLRIQNQPRKEFYVFSEAEHSSPSFRCARNKLQCLTVPQNRKLFRWMLVWGWTGYLFSIYGTWW